MQVCSMYASSCMCAVARMCAWFSACLGAPALVCMRTSVCVCIRFCLRASTSVLDPGLRRRLCMRLAIIVRGLCPRGYA